MSNTSVLEVSTRRRGGFKVANVVAVYVVGVADWFAELYGVMV